MFLVSWRSQNWHSGVSRALYSSWAATASFSKWKDQHHDPITMYFWVQDQSARLTDFCQLKNRYSHCQEKIIRWRTNVKMEKSFNFCPGCLHSAKAAILLFTPLTLETRMQPVPMMWQTKPKGIYMSQDINESKLTLKPSFIWNSSLWFSKASFILARLKNWHKEANIQDGTQHAQFFTR